MSKESNEDSDTDNIYENYDSNDPESFSTAIKVDGFRGCGCDGVCDDGSILMLCRNPAVNTNGFFDKTFKEYKDGFANDGEGWLGLEKLHQLTKKRLHRLKVSLVDRNANEYVGYWDWIKVGAGKGYKLTLGPFLTLYSTLGDALSPDPCGGPRAANANFSARDLDQDGDNTTHCANATFLTDAAGNNWRRGGWWHAGAGAGAGAGTLGLGTWSTSRTSCSRALPTAHAIYWWWNGAPAGAWPQFNGAEQMGTTFWLKGEMRLIPVKIPEEPFEPTPQHNQTMLTNATVKAVVLPSCG